MNKQKGKNPLVPFVSVQSAKKYELVAEVSLISGKNVFNISKKLGVKSLLTTHSNHVQW